MVRRDWLVERRRIAEQLANLFEKERPPAAIAAAAALAAQGRRGLRGRATLPFTGGAAARRRLFRTACFLPPV